MPAALVLCLAFAQYSIGMAYAENLEEPGDHDTEESPYDVLTASQDEEVEHEEHDESTVESGWYTGHRDHWFFSAQQTSEGAAAAATVGAYAKSACDICRCHGQLEY